MKFLYLLLGLGAMAPFVSMARISSILQTRKVYIVEFFEDCQIEGLPWKFANFTFIRNGTTLHIHGEKIISRDLRGPLSLQIRVEKCRDRLYLNSCDYVTTLKWNDFCLTTQMMPFIKHILDNETPPMHCPIKKGHYYIKGEKIQTDVLAVFLAQTGGGESLSRTRFMMFERDQMIGCFTSGQRVADVRNRGHYYIKDEKMQTDVLTAFLAQNGGRESLLKIRFMPFERQQMIACFDSGQRVADVRNRVRH